MRAALALVLALVACTRARATPPDARAMRGPVVAPERLADASAPAPAPAPAPERVVAITSPTCNDRQTVEQLVSAADAGAMSFVCELADGGTGFAVHVVAQTRAALAPALAVMLTRAAARMSESRRQLELELMERESRAPPDAGNDYASPGLVARDPARYAARFGCIAGHVASARDDEQGTHLRVVHAAGLVDVETFERAGDTVVAGARVRACGLWGGASERGEALGLPPQLRLYAVVIRASGAP